MLVRLGNGDGTYEPGGEVTGLSRPQDLVVADFTGDGTEDVAVAAGTAPDRGVALLRGLGNGELSFHTAFTLPHQGFANSMAAADFNGDGREDLVTSAFASVSVHLGTANGTFVTQPELTFGESFPGVVTTGDFDGDANEDLAVELTGGGVPPRLAVIPGKGDGAFGTPKPTDLPNGGLKLTLDVTPAPAPPAPGNGGGGTPGGGGNPAPAGFGAATRVTLGAPRISRGGKVTARVANANAFAVTGKLSGRSRGGKALRLKAKRFRVVAGGQADVVLKAPRALIRRLRGGHAVRLRLSAAVSDPTGARRTVARTARLKGR